MIGETNESMEVTTGKPRGRRVFLIVSAGVMLIALAVAAVFVFGTSAQRVERVLDYNRVMSGVNVNGLDISGLTDEEAKAAAEGIKEELLSTNKFEFNVNGDVHSYALVQLGVGTDYEDIIAQAIDYGHTGSFSERKTAYDTAKSEGMAFTISLKIQEDQLRTALADLKKELDQAPQEASAVFMPCGYTLSADGTAIAFEPDLRAMADAHARYNEIERPDLVRIDAADMPNKLRYKNWETNHYDEENNIPDDANIARFFYTPEVTGLDADTDAIFDQVMNQITSGEFNEIQVPVKVSEAQLKLADIKRDTQLVASWTSCYESHKGAARNWNVSRMSSFVNGVVIQPGKEWSINEEAGPRNASTGRSIGWKQAAGIENGGYSPQYGGGVCQLGSTTYNAAIRANLEIVEFSHHSIPSNYVPLGLDATISTGGPELILKNNNTMPVYLVSYIDPKKMTVTVEVYGQLPVDPTYGESIIYDFYSDNKGTRYGTGGSRTVFNATSAPDGTVLSPENPTYQYSQARAGTKCNVYKRVLSADDGSKLSETLYEVANYRPVTGTTYVYWPESGPPAETTPPADTTTPPADTTTPTDTTTPATPAQ